MTIREYYYWHTIASIYKMVLKVGAEIDKFNRNWVKNTYTVSLVHFSNPKKRTKYDHNYTIYTYTLVHGRSKNITAGERNVEPLLGRIQNETKQNMGKAIQRHA